MGEVGEIVPASVLGRASVVIPDRLYFLSLRGHPKSSDEYFFWTADHDLVYEPFEADFGPLNLSMLVKFCRVTYRYLHAPQLSGVKLYFYSSHDGHKRANAGYLIAAFAVLCLEKTPHEALEIIASSYPPFLPYRDVSCGVSSYNCTIMHCLQGLHNAVSLGWLDWRNFDCEEYEHFEQPANGDWNWIVPPTAKACGKLIAFCAPHAASSEAANGFRYWSPEDYTKVFRERGVTGIVRLCRKTYDKRGFTEVGFKHIDLIYKDGSIPTDSIVTKFLDFVEGNPGGVAIHCKAGLGRTGSLIGCYLMKHYGFSAAAAIAWMRIARPGSVIGPQQQYLVAMENRLTRRKESASPVRMWRGSNVQATPSPMKKQHTEAAPLPATDEHTTSLLHRSKQMQREIDTILSTQSKKSSQIPQVLADEDSELTPCLDPPTPTVGLEVIRQQALQNLRALVSPPRLVERTVLCLMRVLGYTSLKWSVARDKMGSGEMMGRLANVTISTLDEDLRGYLNKMEVYLNDTKCQPANITTVSVDAGQVCRWLHAVGTYCRCALKAVQHPLPALTSSPTDISPPRKKTPKQHARPPPSMIFDHVSKKPITV